MDIKSHSSQFTTFIYKIPAHGPNRTYNVDPAELAHIQRWLISNVAEQSQGIGQLLINNLLVFSLTLTINFIT